MDRGGRGPHPGGAVSAGVCVYCGGWADPAVVVAELERASGAAVVQVAHPGCADAHGRTPVGGAEPLVDCGPQWDPERVGDEDQVIQQRRMRPVLDAGNGLAGESGALGEPFLGPGSGHAQVSEAGADVAAVGDHPFRDGFGRHSSTLRTS